MSKISVSKLKQFTGHRDSIYALANSNQPHLFFSAGGDGFVAEWDLMKGDEGKLLAQLPNSIYAMHYVESLNWLIVGQNFSGIHIIDLATRKEAGSLKLEDAAIFDIKSYGNILIVALGDGSVVIIDLNKLQVLNKLKLSDKSARAIALNPSLKEIAIGFSDNEIRILDFDTLNLKYQLPAHNNSVFSIKYSQDHRYLLSGSRDAHLKVWNTENGYVLHQDIVAHMYAINNIDFSPDFKYFVTCSMDKSIKVWDAEIFKLLKVIDKSRHAGHGTSVNKLLWSGHNNMLISASDDRSIAVWEIKINEEL